MNAYDRIQVIGFDADDTLWKNASYFVEAESQFAEWLSEYISPEDLHRVLLENEIRNLEWYGYGVMSYTLSMIETAINVSHHRVSATVIDRIMALGRSILEHPVELLPNVEKVLASLFGHYRLVLVTKGEMLDQKRKLNLSGLASYFDLVEIVTEKNTETYQQLCHKLQIPPEQFLMVGNSVKSDILPALNIGAQAIHIPCQGLWEHELCHHSIEVTEMPDIISLLNLMLK